MSETVQSLILNHFRNGTAVGIVAFNDNPYILSPMTDLDSLDIRTTVASRVPGMAAGGTGIGGGLQECHRVGTPIYNLVFFLLLKPISIWPSILTK